MVLRVNSSDDERNITLGMYGECCHLVKDVPVVCEMNKGNIFSKSFIPTYSKMCGISMLIDLC